MRIIIIVLALMNPVFAFSASIRDDFHHHDLTKEKLLEIVESDEYERSALTMAYKGVCETMLAEHVFLPTTKWKHFNRGKNDIDKAVQKAPENGEIRYLRLLVQLNAPGMLGYNRDIEKDFIIFVRNIRGQETEEQWILEFVNNLLKGKYLKSDQKRQLQSLKDDLI